MKNFVGKNSEEEGLKESRLPRISEEEQKTIKGAVSQS